MTDGIAGPKTWAALDEATVGAPETGPSAEAGGGTPEAPTDTGVGTTDTGEGEPQARAEGSIHPVLTPGFTGSAASELQHKLNGAVFFAFPIIPVTGVYDPFTVSAVAAFRALNNISDPTVGPQDVGPVTWAVLDKQVPGSPVGRVDKRGARSSAARRIG